MVGDDPNRQASAISKNKPETGPSKERTLTKKSAFVAVYFILEFFLQIN